MMKKLTLFSVVMLLMGITSFAQSVSPCGFDVLHQQKMLTDHAYESSVREVDNRWAKYTSLMSTAMLTYTSAGYVYEIPMVVHVLHTGGAVGTKYNPDSVTIAAMVTYLNKAYAAVSPFPDTTAGGCRIPLKFVLAKRSPSGAATNGIIRLDASTIPNYVAYGANASTSSGVDAATIMAFSRWNPSDYYNVYSVNKIDGNDLYSTGGIAGYAYFPGSPTLDGMIVCASQVKSGSTTVAHEFGHGFSLYHTFQGDGGTTSCPANANCNTDGDMVCDTEPHWGSNHWPGWCPPNDVNPCTGSSYKNVQKNIMDYTQCPPNRFTAGQRLRFLNILNNERTGFKYSYGLVAPTGTVNTACIPTSSGVTGNVGPYIVDFNGSPVWTGDLNMERFAYVDHSYTQQTYVEKGIAYPISVQTRYNKQNVKVFIDYNNDGDFVDAGETVFTHNGTTSSTETHSGTITIPAAVVTCNWLRMRVVAAMSTASIADYACGPYANNAQAEDYAIYVKNRSAIDTVTIAQTFGSNPSCTGSLVTFRATPKGGTPTYRWFINGVATTNTTNTYSSTTLANNDIITCKTYYTGACGLDSAVSNYIQLLVNSTAKASATNSLIVGTNPGCTGLSLVFKVAVSGGGSAPVYAWKKNGITVGGNVDTFASSTLVAGDKIWCNVTPNSTCSIIPVNSDTITIVFGSIIPTANVALTSGTIPSCDSSLLTFTATPTLGGTAPAYQWFVNGVAITGATNSFVTSAAFKNNDTVKCRMISNHPCIVPGVGDTAYSNTFVVKRNTRVMPTLSVALTKGANPGCLDSLIEFTATATDGGGSPTIVWYVNGAIASYGSIYGTTSLVNGDSVMCKMFVTAGSCNTVDSLVWGPMGMIRSTTPSAPVISLIGNLLVSSVTTGIQWYGPHGLIPGATGATYHPTEQGNYYAVVVNAGCNSDPSNVLNVSLLSVSPYNMNEVRIYPNPSTGLLILDWGTDKINATVDVYTVTGQRVYTTSIENQSKQTLNLTQLSNGNYFVVIRDAKGKTGTVSVSLSK
jgi:hypothetical protein